MKNVSLFKRKRSNSYLIQYTDDHGSRKILSTRCALKSDALRFLAALQAEQHTPKTDSKTLSAFTSDFLAYAKSQFRPTTVAIYRPALSVLLTSVGNVSIDSITARHVDRWKAEMPDKTSRRGGKLSTVYIKIHFRSLKAALTIAVRWGLMKTNPFASCKSLSSSGKEPASLTVADFNRLLSMIHNDVVSDFVIFAINTGARRDEILSLKWNAVDIEHRFIVIPEYRYI